MKTNCIEEKVLDSGKMVGKGMVRSVFSRVVLCGWLILAMKLSASDIFDCFILETRILP